MPGALTDKNAQQNVSPGASRPTYKGRRPASERASAAARGSSKKTDTSCELLLRRALWAAGFRYRKDVKNLPGRPDIVFPKAKLAVFCDGDFWHGRNWEERRQKLEQGTNPDYWLAKIERNMERDRQNAQRLQEMGWAVLRFWESEIRASPSEVTGRVVAALKASSAEPPLDKNHPIDVNRA
jgi:DNA mismatch endonuclease (patch repair protein)